jgi:hypothetical protein
VKRPAIPLGDVGALVGPFRRTLVFRLALAGALAAALAAAYLGAHRTGKHGSLLPSGKSPIVAIDMSWSVSYDNYDQIERTLDDLAGSGRRIGLVLFSDIAYEALPPGTPASELRPYLHFFRARGTPNPWQEAFAGGTRIWSALDLAHRMLQRDHVGNGAVVLISDLADAPNDRALLAQSLSSYVSDRIPVKIVALDPTPEDARLFERALAHGGGTVERLGPAAHTATPRRTRPALPTTLLASALALALLLGVNEAALGRLAWRARRVA